MVDHPGKKTRNTGEWNISRICLVVISIVFMITGLALIIVGAMFKARWQGLRDAFSSIQEESYFITYAGDTLAIAIILWGVFVLVLSVIGLQGALCNIRLLLSVYALIVGILSVAEIIILVIVLVKASKAQAVLSTALKDSFSGYRESGDDPHSNSIAALFSTLQCCGVNGDADFSEGADKIRWEPDKKKREFTGNNSAQYAAETKVLPFASDDTSGWFNTHSYELTASDSTSEEEKEEETPVAGHSLHRHSPHRRAADTSPLRPITCCPDVDYEHLSPQVFESQRECLETPQYNMSFPGCYQKISDVIQSTQGIAIGVFVAVLLLEILVVVLTCFMCCRDNTEKYYKKAQT